MLEPNPPFWSFTAGQLLTPIGVIIAWLISKAWDLRGMKDSISTVDQRVTAVISKQDKYDSGQEERDKLIITLEKTVVVLQTLSDQMDRRLKILEEVYLDTVVRKRLADANDSKH